MLTERLSKTFSRPIESDDRAPKTVHGSGRLSSLVPGVFTQAVANKPNLNTFQITQNNNLRLIFNERRVYRVQDLQTRTEECSVGEKTLLHNSCYFCIKK